MRILNIEMQCSHCGRTAYIDIPASSLKDATDSRAPSGGIYKEILLGCKNCKTHVRIFINVDHLLPGHSLLCDDTDEITTYINVK